MGGKQIKKAMGGRIGLKEGNGKDDSMTGIAMAIEERMRVICQGIWEKTEYPGKEKWSPSFYGSKSVREFLRQICNALAREGFIKTPKGKRLRQLEEKRTAAIDVVMGMTETEPTIHAVNKILKGTNIPLLGGK